MYQKFFKRFIDILLSSVGLIVLGPFMMIVVLLIKIDDPGPAIFKQDRVGIDKKIFKLYKFRSMKLNTPNVATHLLENPEQYLLKTGGFIRKFSIDELPQMINILKGDMSIIGPRPALWNQYDLIEERDKYGVNEIKPGLTGWAQINGRDALTIENKAKLDGEYAKNQSFKFDLKCFFGTILKVLNHEDVIEGGNKKTNTYSVLMSVYEKDNADFLKESLESIYDNQTVKPNEIVVVFDGPLASELYEVLDDFKKGKEDIVKYLPQKENKGLGEALRIGSNACTCDYIFRMDADDISNPHRFEKQISFLNNHSDIDVLGTDIAEFIQSLDENMRIRSCPEDHNDIVKMGKRRNPMNHVSVCIKKSALMKSGGYQTLLLLEDYYLWLNMIFNGCKFANLKETLVYVRVGNGFDNKRGSKERIKGWKVLQDLMLKNGLISKREAFINMIYIWVFVNMPPILKKFAYDKILRT